MYTVLRVEHHTGPLTIEAGGLLVKYSSCLRDPRFVFDGIILGFGISARAFRISNEQISHSTNRLGKSSRAAKVVLR